MRARPVFAIAVLAVFAGVAACYAPGLSGGFLFDDYANLPALGAYGPVTNWTTLVRYLTSGTADPTGRPLALASFLIDARNWPAEPFSFKCTNVVIHLANGGLLLWLLTLLGRELGVTRRRARWAALVGAGLWLAHPLLVSTTLYIVQRETMLAATFALAGLIGYVLGRGRVLAGRPWRGGLAALAGLAAGTLAATLCKANGTLTPLLAAVLEGFVLRTATGESRGAVNALRAVAIGVPVALLGAYLWTKAPADWSTVPGSRPWSYAQRVLTEPRVVLDYLKLLWLPRAYTTGLFNDQIHASTGWLSPWTTLPALLVIAGLPAGAWAIRRRAPALAAAVFFYYAGHLLESTFIALELYYEHRNYLPAALMFWPLAVWLTAHGNRRRARAALTVALLVGLGALTALRADVWGDTAEQAAIWARINPDSPRAVANAAQIDTQRGHARRAAARLTRALKTHPDQPQLTLNLINARCQLGDVDRATIKQAARSLATSERGASLLFKWFAAAIGKARRGTCPGLDLAALDELLAGARDNPAIVGSDGARQSWLNLRARVALARGDGDIAAVLFSRALAARPAPAAALKQAAELGSGGRYCAGIAQLDQFSHLRNAWGDDNSYSMAWLHAWVLRRQHYWQDQLRHVRGVLNEQARAHRACCVRGDAERQRGDAVRRWLTKRVAG